MRPTSRWGITLPLSGMPLTGQRDLVAALPDLGYTDAWSSEVNGHDAFTPSRTGIGERAHLTSPQVTLGTHVQDVVNHVLFEGLDDIVLLGFSYGGMVVTGSLLHIADRVRHLVYLDAFVPADGDSLESLARLAGLGATGVGDDWLVPPGSA